MAKRVLVVEDNEAVREVLVRALGLWGYEVQSAPGVKKAGILPAEPAFDLLIIDVVLPEASGVDLLDSLLGRWPEAKALLMSGYSRDDLERLEPNLDRFVLLQKPFDLEKLRIVVGETLAAPDY